MGDGPGGTGKWPCSRFVAVLTAPAPQSWRPEAAVHSARRGVRAESREDTPGSAGQDRPGGCRLLFIKGQEKPEGTGVLGG